MTFFRAVSLVAAVGVYPCLAAHGQSPWLTLAEIDGHRVQIDTAATTEGSSYLSVRLRWFYPDKVVVERTDVDCRRARTRIIESREEFELLGLRVKESRAVDPKVWVGYSAGSLGGEALRAVCRYYAARPIGGR
ncbi:MAG TPA: hypothetical protein VI729_08910 [Anaerolineales bacterium]|nr:hypothetical protein [Anaerolineales bacterium]